MDALHIFGCGVSKQNFEAKFNALEDEDQQRLERVARRIWVTLKLKYETSVYQSPFDAPNDNLRFAHSELAALEIYLLVTCLDTLAGKPQHMYFPDWLKKQPDVTDLNLDKVKMLYQQYIVEYGVSKNLSALFSNLPLSTKEWLAHNVSLRKIEQPLSVEDADSNSLVQNLFTYFYEIRRNEYTHSSRPRQVPMPDDIRLSDETGWWVTPASGTHFPLERRHPNKLWNFSYRQGLDEATILRLIIHSVALQKLDIPVTEELINLNLRNLSRLDGLYSFLGEIAHNANMLNAWTNIEERSKHDLKSYLLYVGVPVLNDQAASRMLDRYDVDKDWETGYRQLNQQCIEEVNYLNTLITDFNEKNPKAKPMQDNIDAHWQAIKRFLNELLAKSAAKWIIQLPITNEITNLWLIIRNPCHI